MNPISTTMAVDEAAVSSTAAASRRAFIPLFLTLIASAVGHSYFVITFPAMAREYSLTDMQAGFVMGSGALVLTLASPFWGWICDIKGRRFALLFGAVGSTLGLALLALVFTASQREWLPMQTLLLSVLAVRWAHACASAGLMPAAQAVIADVTSPTRRSRGMGLLGGSFGIGTVLGGALAMATGGEHVLEGFYAISLALLLCSLWLWFSHPETANDVPQTHACHQNNIETTSSSVEPLKPVAMLPFLLTTLLCLTVYSLIQQVTALRLQDDFGLDFNTSVQFAGRIMMASMAAMIFSQLILVAVLKLAPRTMAMSGAAISSTALMIAAMANDPQSLLMAMALMGLGVGVLLPCNLALLSLTTGQQHQAKAAGINGFSKGIGMAVGPVLGAAVYANSTLMPYWLGAVLLALVLLIFVAMMVLSRD